MSKYFAGVLILLASFPANAQQAYATPRDAVKALYAAAKAGDTAALLEVFGPNGKDLISSGDEVADQNERDRFVKNYAIAHKLVADGPDKFILQVGADNWPLAVPIVKTEKGWSFDADAGKQEILYRRIGRNEEDAIRVCRALIEAEHAYRREGHDGNPPGQYTRKLVSDPGKQNGLYWETAEGEPPSPGGPLLAEAAGDNYARGPGKHQPFHGYLYRVLTAQGPNARGGARDYVVDGKLTRGFAIVAYPAEYRVSGVMTFIVNQQGVVYEKDLGEETESLARAMTTFDPDSSWKAAK